MNKDVFDKLIDYNEKVEQLTGCLSGLQELEKILLEFKNIGELIVKYRQEHSEDMELTEIFDKILKIIE